MSGVLAGVLLWIAGGLLSLACSRRPSAAQRLGSLSLLAGSVLIVVPAIGVMLTGQSLSLACNWPLPLGAFHVGMDRLSAFFVIPIAVVSACAGVFGVGYLAHARGSVASAAFFFNVLAAAMAMVVLARNAVLFLLAWELMSLSSFVLVLFDSERGSARRAGWIYLVAMHIGAAFLLAFFVLMAHWSGSWEFDAFRHEAAAVPLLANTAFLLAVVGFGTKAGLMPLHVWLPEAHPEAPSHVSALMSGVMIKTGIYGIVRTIALLWPPPLWWGWVLLAFGVVSGIMGVLMAMAQRDLKRLLAYSSVENIGIVSLGLGLGVIGCALDMPVVAVTGFAGALLHVLNHAVFKSLLFMGAGSVHHATGTRDMEQLGGLMKRMPATGIAFVTGAASISGLPPMNGFVSEFLIFFAALRLVLAGDATGVAAGLLTLVGLGLIGCLAATCFVKAAGVVFLGEPRSERAAGARESGRSLTVPMALLALGCAAIGFAAPWAAAAAAAVAGSFAGELAPLAALDCAIAPLWGIVGAAGLVAALSLLFLWLRLRLLRGRAVAQAPTWDCGYVKPAARMQYTSSSFTDPILRVFHVLLRTRRRQEPLRVLFPARSSFATETPDFSHEGMYEPLFEGVRRTASRFYWIQHGRVNLYILAIAVALLGLLIWKMPSTP